MLYKIKRVPKCRRNPFLSSEVSSTPSRRVKDPIPPRKDVEHHHGHHADGGAERVRVEPPKQAARAAHVVQDEARRRHADDARDRPRRVGDAHDHPRVLGRWGGKQASIHSKGGGSDGQPP